MTVILKAKDIIARLSEKFPGCLAEAGTDSVLVEAAAIPAVVQYLREGEGLEFDYLNFITAVDYYQYFEVVYHLTSLKHNHAIFLKTRCYDRENPSVPSVVGIFQGADFQEREIYDLFGIKFEGHPDLRRIFLWEGFPGHPLRKDFNQ
ncbi:MAG: NADH-quinone oxidoreductase subunit C [Dehalococcoidales bacterium]|nr:NADH-quinone oxidoreductase subunit C [Dehalococcoidales bacterium]